MGQLANQRHEAFVHAYLTNGMVGRDAYKAAYPRCKKDEGADVNASRLLRDAKVSARIEELQERSGERVGITLDGLIEEAAALQVMATQGGALNAAISALIAKAKLAGLWV